MFCCVNQAGIVLIFGRTCGTQRWILIQYSINFCTLDILWIWDYFVEDETIICSHRLTQDWLKLENWIFRGYCNAEAFKFRTLSRTAGITSHCLRDVEMMLLAKDEVVTETTRAIWDISKTGWVYSYRKLGNMKNLLPTRCAWILFYALKRKQCNRTKLCMNDKGVTLECLYSLVRAMNIQDRTHFGQRCMEKSLLRKRSGFHCTSCNVYRLLL